MNKEIIEFARGELKKGLAQCSEKQQLMFKRMYSHHDLSQDINKVVDTISVDRLEWAMQQVNRTQKMGNKHEQ